MRGRLRTLLLGIALLAAPGCHLGTEGSASGSIAFDGACEPAHEAPDHRR